MELVSHRNMGREVKKIMMDHWYWIIVFGMFSTVVSAGSVTVALFFHFKPFPSGLPMQTAVHFGSEFVRLGGLYGSAYMRTAGEPYIRAYAPPRKSCIKIPWCYEGYRVRVVRVKGPAQFAV